MPSVTNWKRCRLHNDRFARVVGENEGRGTVGGLAHHQPCQSSSAVVAERTEHIVAEDEGAKAVHCSVDETLVHAVGPPSSPVMARKVLVGKNQPINSGSRSPSGGRGSGRGRRRSHRVIVQTLQF